MHRILNTIVYILLLLSIAPIAEAKDFVIVIDPGHGGKDAGALGMRTNEKSINLNVALKLKRMLERDMDDVKVLMTRDSDRFIPLQKEPTLPTASMPTYSYPSTLTPFPRNHLHIDASTVPQSIPSVLTAATPILASPCERTKL